MPSYDVLFADDFALLLLEAGESIVYSPYGGTPTPITAVVNRGGGVGDAKRGMGRVRTKGGGATGRRTVWAIDVAKTDVAAVDTRDRWTIDGLVFSLDDGVTVAESPAHFSLQLKHETATETARPGYRREQGEDAARNL